MSKIHRFQRYSQPENVVTNNVLMLLHRLYDESPRKFQKALSLLVQEQAEAGSDIEIGPRFTQQVRGPARVADGMISQQRFDLLIETKLGNYFNAEQAIGHLAHLKDSPNGILLLLGREPRTDDDAVRRAQAEAANYPHVRVLVSSFRAVIDACRQTLASHEDDLIELVEDFESFCLGENLLPVEEQLMFVPPCGKSWEENLRWRLYYCPTYRSLRAGNWLGIYTGKRVIAVGHIEARIRAYKDTSGTVVTEGATEEQRDRILGAARDAELRGWDLLSEEGHTFYVCGQLLATEFCKDSPGGIVGHRYFDLKGLKQGREELTAEFIAQRLRELPWSHFGQY